MNDEPSPADDGTGPYGGPEERRATALLLLLAVLVLASVAYVLYARGAFEPTQRLVLLADDSEGVVAGMDLSFSGFPIGRVRRTELAPEGHVRILIDVPTQDARWLRTSSVFTMTRGLVGGTAIRAYSGILDDPPLPDGAERRVLAGDAGAEIPRLLSAARELMLNLGRMSADDSALSATLDSLQRASARLDEQLAGRRGALGALLGEDAARVAAVLERTQQLLARLDAVAQRADGLVQRTDGVIARADDKLLGEQGLVDDAQAAARQLGQLLGQARISLQKVDGLLQDAQAVAAQARVASADLGVLRAEVDASLRQVQRLVDDLERRWPFKPDPELRLP